MEKTLVLYVHGKNGKSSESRHYKKLFPDCDVVGINYKESMPWEVKEELEKEVRKIWDPYDKIILIANSIGAYFSMISDLRRVDKAFFISPIVDMEKLILDMMKKANVSPEELKSKGIIHTDFGEDLSWEYFSYVKKNPIGKFPLDWCVSTNILYGKNDDLTSYETILKFVNKNGRRSLTVMENGGHYFHTKEEMKFLDKWIKSCQEKPVRFYILGNVQRPAGMSRIKAEIIINSHFYHFDNWNLEKTDEEMLQYNNSVCVIHIHSEIYGRGGRDVSWRYWNLSLYQMSSGKFFLAGVDVDDFNGGSTLYLELDRDYFENHKLSEFKDLLYKECSRLDKGESFDDIEKLFEKRELSFYAERWTSYDYKVLFRHSKSKKAIREEVDYYKKEFEDSPEKEILYSHVEKEAQKAIEQIKNGGWWEKQYDVYEYDPYLAEFK